MLMHIVWICSPTCSTESASKDVVTKTRMEAFSDGVIAILITIMILELKIPHGADVAALRAIAPSFVA